MHAQSMPWQQNRLRVCHLLVWRHQVQHQNVPRHAPIAVRLHEPALLKFSVLLHVLRPRRIYMYAQFTIHNSMKYGVFNVLLIQFFNLV